MSMFGFKKMTKDMGIDLGTANTLVYIKGHQHDEMGEDRPKLKELIKTLNCKPLYFDEKDKYYILED